MPFYERVPRELVGNFKERQAIHPIKRRSELWGLPGFFPEQLADPLIALSDNLAFKKQERKHTYTFPPEIARDLSLSKPDDLPQPILDAASEFTSYFGWPINTSVLKRYDKDDVY